MKELTLVLDRFSSGRCFRQKLCLPVRRNVRIPASNFKFTHPNVEITFGFTYVDFRMDKEMAQVAISDAPEDTMRGDCASGDVKNDKASEKEDIVTPWNIEAASDEGVDYDKIIGKFLLYLRFLLVNSILYGTVRHCHCGIFSVRHLHSGEANCLP